MWQWLANLFGTPRQALQAQAPRIAVQTQVVNDDPQLTQLSTYQHASWVYVAVNRIAEAGALVPLHITRTTGEQARDVVQHPLVQLLDQPNPFTSRFELLEQTLGYLELTGNAYWFIAGDARGRPAQIWVLRPDRVTIVPDERHYIRGYVYEVDGKQLPFEPVEIVHFKRWHPTNDYYGLSALAAAQLAVESDRAMARWNRNTFGQDQGVPAGIVNIQEFVSDQDFERIKREWRNSYGGAQRRTAFLRGGAVEWQNIGLSHTDLDFLQGRIAHRDEILSIFGIPIGLISENATEANAKVAERQFIERTLYPKLVRLAQKITQELLPFYAGAWGAHFDDIRPTDSDLRLREIQTAQNVLSINEIRQRYYHLPPVTWGTYPVAYDHTPPADAEASASATTDEASKSIADELAQWERFALNRAGQDDTRPFAVTVIPADLAIDISARLLTAEDKTTIKQVFAQIRATLDPASTSDIATTGDPQSP